MICFKDFVFVIIVYCVYVLRFNVCKMDDFNIILVVCYILFCYRI